MQGHDIITVGASAGGVEALLATVRDLPADFPAALFAVVHTSPTRPSLLADILARVTRLQVAAALDGEPIEPGHIYVAPPDNHLLVASGFVRVVRGAKENGHRPAVDPLFRTAARVYGPRVVGVVLSGMRDCGTVGLQEVKRYGGIAVVQDPSDALFPGMPQSALDNVEVDHCVPLAGIPLLLDRLAREPANAPKREPAAVSEEPERDFVCPECGGYLTRTQTGSVLSFGCKVGHRFSLESLEAEQAATLETALWVALRAIEDSTALARRLAARSARANREHARALYLERACHGEIQAALVRKALLGGGQGASPEEDTDGMNPPRRIKP